MQTSIEARRLFLRELGRQAPQIIFDLFDRNDPQEWAGRWGILSEWLIQRAEFALEGRRGNRAQAHALRRRGHINEQEELRAWNAAAGAFARPLPLRIEVEAFGADEDFHYLSRAELARRFYGRIEQAIDAYHKAVFEDDPYFGLYRQLPKTRAGQDEKHLRWLIEYISGKSDPEIAAGEKDHDAEAVRKGRRAFERMIELKLADRRGKGNRTRRR